MAFSLPVAEATARDYLARAEQADIHDHQQMVTAHGWLTQTLGNLLDSIEADRTEQARTALKAVS